VKPPQAVVAHLLALADHYNLPESAPERLAALLDLVAREPAAITSVRDPAEAADVHVADSLTALDLDIVRRAGRIADLGSGAGFPGLVLAIALPQARVALVDSVARKGRFLLHASAALELANTEVVIDRAETWSAGLGRHDLVTARAVAALPVLIEYAAPLLTPGGALVAWKGRRSPPEEADGRVAAGLLGMSAPAGYEREATARAAHRTLYVSTKIGSTPNGFPRRAGMARKRPLGALRGGASSSPPNL
jgi:16S rRNA (guanine527-N7)-methyltransferase